MTTKLPKLPEGETRCRYTGESAYTAEQTQAYAREAVADALRPTGDNAEHLRYLESKLVRVRKHLNPKMHAALTAAITALSQPSVAVSGDKEMLNYLMQQFDGEVFCCHRCGNEEPTSESDSALVLRAYLGPSHGEISDGLHVSSEDCWCHPESVGDGVWLHKAKEGRN